MEITQRQIDLGKLVAMIILIIVMIVLSYTVIKYGTILKTNPCSLCDCTIDKVSNWNVP